jgi:hypothetical protein
MLCANRYEGYTLAVEAKLVQRQDFLINWKQSRMQSWYSEAEISYTSQGTDLNYQDDEG